MMTTFDAMAEIGDADLVARSLRGDREAFSQIVMRYQTLVCSLAYNVLGNLGESEDAAQETFIVAWKRLRHLREPSKLRAWLCGIVQNRARDRVRQEQREPVGGAESLDAAEEMAGPEPLPSERAISAEEQAILWRALGRMPEIYREPLILYYREQRSVERVAEALELTGDAVKQRLARGRKLLHQEVIDFVEETLGKSTPGRRFTTSVLSALPATPGLIGAGTAGAATKSAAAKSSGALAMIAGSIASAAGILAGLGAQWLILRATPTPLERRVKALWFGAIWLIVGFAWGAQPVLHAVGRHFAWSEQATILALALNWWVYAVLVTTVAIAAFRWVLALRRRQAAETGRPTAPSAQARGWRMLVLTGLVYGANIWWIMALALGAGDRASAWALGAATAALIALHFVRLRGKNCDEAMAVHASQLALVWGLILLTVNVRLDSWMAAARGINLAQWRELLAPWVVPGLTAALLAWVGGALWLTRPRAGGSGVTL